MSAKGEIYTSGLLWCECELFSIDSDVFTSDREPLDAVSHWEKILLTNRLPTPHFLPDPFLTDER